MNLTDKTQQIYLKVSDPSTKLGDLRVIAKEIKKDHELAIALWKTAGFLPRMLALLLMDVKALDAGTIDGLFHDMLSHEPEEHLQLADWLMANQLTKDKIRIAHMESWQNHASPLHRRIFWYYQGRLRWTGQVPPGNTEELLCAVEAQMLHEAPEVQWAMNFTTGWIGIFDPAYRSRCIKIGEKLGLYKDEMVAKNCTPNYLPLFIGQVVEKRKL